MIECSNCQTLNPDSGRSCLACGATFAAATVSAPLTARCPAGHPIDPSWRSCPYCDRAQASGGDSVRPLPTRLEEAGASNLTRLEGEPLRSLPPTHGGPMAPKATRLEEPGPAPVGRKTLLDEGLGTAASNFSAESPPHSNPLPADTASSRRLVAVLAAPALGPGGTVFPVRLGKNSIGADRTNEIVLGGDSEVSREHAVILHRAGAFVLADRLSTNGTWVNGIEVPANGTVPLRDRDRIRCGKTDFVFLIIEAALADSAEARADS